MNQPLLHRRTAFLSQLFISGGHHGLLLVGEPGVGKQGLAQWLAAQRKLPTMVLAPESGKRGISINQIRELYTTTRTGEPLAIIIPRAGGISHEGQNAFLKLLEQPPGKTLFILLAQSVEELASTIVSRCGVIDVLPIERPELDSQLQRLQPQLSVLERQRVISLHGARMAAIEQSFSAADDESEASSMAQAKHFYAGSASDRLLLAQTVSSATKGQQLLDNLVMIIEALLPLKAGAWVARQRLIRQAELVEQIAQRLELGAQVKIQFTELALQL